MKPINLSIRRDYLSKAFLAVWVSFLLAFAILLAGPSTGQAMPPDPIERTPIPKPPYPVPTNGFNWSMTPRFGSMKDGLVDYHWNETTQTYDDFVRATTFTVTFNGCRTQADANTGTSALTYAWTFNGQTTTNHECRTVRSLAQGTYTVSLRITGGTTPLGPFTQTVVVKDLLIVALGDSYGAGEGSPDVPQQLTKDGWGNVTSVTAARWESLRCHRSANAPDAQAARQLENADPHTSVTFMSFACSGATINRNYYADQNPVQPYSPDGESSGIYLSGSGILGPYAGRVPPDPYHPQNNQLLSQVDQLKNALGSRQVDALILSAGGNDMGFGNVATLCLLFDNCGNYMLDDSTLSYTYPANLDLRVRRDRFLGLPPRYDALAQALSSIPMAPNGKVYITEYPGLTSNDQGALCSEMLTDVVPWLAEGSLVEYAYGNGATQDPGTPFAIRGADVQFALSVTVMLNDAVNDAAANHGWVLVNGIAPQSGDLFSKHGYCATDSWVRHAADSVNRQGPWSPSGTSPNPPGTGELPNSMLTTGTLHPTESGYAAIAAKVYAKIKPNLLPTAP